jgi:hypothetical protein
MITNECLFDYAMSFYRDTSTKTLDEFTNDLQKFIHLKKLFNRDDANPRLILNHIITLYNSFHPEGCTNILFFRIDESKWSELKTYLVFLNFLPERLEEHDIDLESIPLSQKVIDILRTI